METEVMTVEVTEIEAKTTPAIEKARGLIIQDQEDFAAAGEFLKELKGVQNEIDIAFDDIIKQAHETHKAAVAKKKRYTEPVAQADTMVRSKMSTYVAQQKHIQEETARKADEERRRLEAEARQKQAEEAAKARKADEDARLAAAAEAQARGNAESAERILNAPPPPPPPLAPIVMPQAAPPVEMPKVAGVSFREVWKLRSVDKNTLIHAAAKNPELYAGYLLVDEKALNALAKALKGEARCPGAEFMSEQQSAVRS